MKLNVNFDQSQSSLPSGFVAAVNYVAGYFDSLFSKNVTVTINVGYGEIAGQKLISGDLGESEQVNVSSVGYSTVRSDLLSQGAPGSSTLPATSPAPSGDTLFVPSAQEKALGITSNNASLDGYTGFDSVAGTFSYATGSAPPANEYYFVGVVEHEFTEIMGRTSYLYASSQYSAMDLYRYAGVNTRQFTTNGPSYFSVDNGQTNLNNWNNFQTGNNGDLGDWAPSAGDDAFADNSNPGRINSLSPSDLTLMAALGWQTASLPSFFAAPGTALNIVYNPNGSNLPSAVSGSFNLEVITAATGNNYTPQSGYQGIALLNTGTNPSLNLLSGNFGVADTAGFYSITAGSGDESIGGAAHDTITGGTGNQFIDGSAGSQSITGGSAGNETIWGGVGDVINGGSGAAVTIGGAAGDTIQGGTGTAVLDGWKGNQRLTGGSGSETIVGGAGDTITGGTGTEFINGTGGNLLITGGSAGNETIWAGAGDTIAGGGSASETIGGVRFDTITGGTGTEFLDGSAGYQSLTGGSAGNETVWGGAGDAINGGSGASMTIGGAAGDTIQGGTGPALLDGWKGNQLITGGGGSETIGGGAGDTIVGGTGTEFINATGGNQSVTGGSAGNETIWAGAGDNINGGSGANVTIGGVRFDTITGGSGPVFIDGSAGSQSITAGSGKDTIWGGAGDTIAGGSGHALIGLSGGAEYVGDNGTAGGVDTAGGFNQAAHDRIFFPNETASSINSVIATASTSGGNTTIVFPDGSTLTLNDITQIDSSFFG